MKKRFPAAIIVLLTAAFLSTAATALDQPRMQAAHADL
jgi:hypothetical protein